MIIYMQHGAIVLVSIRSPDSDDVGAETPPGVVGFSGAVARAGDVRHPVTTVDGVPASDEAVAVSEPGEPGRTRVVKFVKHGYEHELTLVVGDGSLAQAAEVFERLLASYQALEPVARRRGPEAPPGRPEFGMTPFGTPPGSLPPDVEEILPRMRSAPEEVPPTPSGPALRFDGLYQADKGEGIHEYLRFYPDRLVLFATTTVEAAKVAQWLNTSSQRSTRRLYRLDESKIEISQSLTGSTVGFQGMVGEGSVTLEWQDRVKGEKVSRTYRFVPVVVPGASGSELDLESRERLLGPPVGPTPSSFDREISQRRRAAARRG